LDDYKRYLYLCLIEEASEVIKDAIKILRFGEGNYIPEKPEATNLMRLQDELTDLNTLQQLLNLPCYFSEEKKAKVERYFKVSNELTGR
jgi:hypothetical protein